MNGTEQNAAVDWLGPDTFFAEPQEVPVAAEPAQAWELYREGERAAFPETVGAQNPLPPASGSDSILATIADVLRTGATVYQSLSGPGTHATGGVKAVSPQQVATGKQQQTMLLMAGVLVVGVLLMAGGK